MLNFGTNFTQMADRIAFRLRFIAERLDSLVNDGFVEQETSIRDVVDAMQLLIKESLQFEVATVDSTQANDMKQNARRLVNDIIKLRHSLNGLLLGDDAASTSSSATNDPIENVNHRPNPSTYDQTDSFFQGSIIDLDGLISVCAFVEHEIRTTIIPDIEEWNSRQNELHGFLVTRFGPICICLAIFVVILAVACMFYNNGNRRQRSL